MKRRRQPDTSLDSLDSARHYARRLREEILLPAVESLCAEFNRRGAGRRWNVEANPSLRREGEFIARGFSLAAGLEIIVSVSGTAAGFEIVVNVDRLDKRGRIHHAYCPFPIRQIEMAGEWALQQLTTAGETVLRAVKTVQTNRR
jgi:hypothetical protein